MIAVVDYGVGNLRSIAVKLHRVGFDDVVVSSEIADIKRATKLILPGVGAFPTAMDSLRERGLLSVLEEKVTGERVPILGICLGMQLMTRWSEEGEVGGFGWLNATTLSLRKHSLGTKVPHMGWDTVSIKSPSPIMKDLPPDAEFYFVHSYFISCEEINSIVATTTYGCEFAVVVNKGNIFGTQFHPEKSHRNGMTVLKNFAEYGAC
jgi:glutamine amidotransferase